MATVYEPPFVVAQKNKEADLARRMSSIDPVERWRAKEEAVDSYSAQLGRQMAAQAEKAASAYQAEIRRCEEADRRNSKYRTLPPGAKISKN